MSEQNLQDILLEHFKWFHRHPEQGGEEVKTTAHIRDILDAAGVEIIDTGLQTGLVARISGAADGPAIALRSDIDALPIIEESGLDYASETEGTMHACGHDFHLTSMLGAALLLKKRQNELFGTVKLLFQPAEEIGFGAKAILESGVLDDVKEIYGLHVETGLPVGTISVSEGANYAAVGGFRIVIKGKGGHASAPHECIDPVIAAAQIINAAQTIVSRDTSPYDQVVVSITSVQIGNTWNVIPGDGLLEGTIRSLGTEQFNHVAEKLGEICKGVALVSGTEIDYFWQLGAPSTNNDKVLSDFVADTARDLDLTVVPGIPCMGGEDFALYQQRIPGVFWTIGVDSPQVTHHPQFIANPAPLETASKLLTALAIRSLQRLSNPGAWKVD